MATLTIDAVTKRFGTFTALDRVGLEVGDGRFVALLGPSGCGKTTLLRLIAGLETPTAGRIAIAGEDVTALPPEKRRIAMMFQSYALLPHMTVLENVRFPLRMQKSGSAREPAGAGCGGARFSLKARRLWPTGLPAAGCPVGQDSSAWRWPGRSWCEARGFLLARRVRCPTGRPILRFLRKHGRSS